MLPVSFFALLSFNQKKMIMIKICYLIPLFTMVLLSCSKPTFYDFDTEFGLEIKNKAGKNVLDGPLEIEKITHSGSNNGQEPPTEGYDTPDTPPIDGFTVTKKGESSILTMFFSPRYRESVITIKWKDIAKEDTIKADLYRHNHAVYIGKIFWNGEHLWESKKNGKKNQITVIKTD